MAKRVLRSLSILVVLAVWVLLPGGCHSTWERPGETVAETARRHDRIRRVNQSEMLDDIDMILLLDQPSRLTDKRIP